MEEILVKYFSGEASKEEINKVEEWRSATENNSKDFFEFKKVWLITQPDPAPDKSVLASILGEDDEPEIKIIPIWQQKSFKLAASIIVVLGLFFTVFQLSKTEVTYGQPVATLTTYDLPDGTKVTLRKGASLNIGDFKTKREVELVGKAFFEVARDEQKPFYVSTRDAVVQVLGTSFVVNAADDAVGVEVMVNSGKVAFGQNPEVYGDQAISIDLVEGDMGVIKKGERGVKKLKIIDQNYLAWKTKILTFQKTSLEDVAKTMEDVFEVDIQFETPKLKKCHLTAKFKNKSAEEVAEIISETFSLNYVSKEDQIVFSGEGCN